MRIVVPGETAPGEQRVALVPESCKKLIRAGYEIAIEAGAGRLAGFGDSAYRDSGVAVETDPARSDRLGRSRAEGQCASGRPAARRSRLDETGRNLPRVADAAAQPRRGARARRAQGHRFFNRRDSPDHAGAVHGHALVDGQHRRLQERPSRRRPRSIAIFRC